MDRAAKEALVVEMKEIFTKSAAAVLVDYRGLAVNEIIDLRKRLNKASASIRILKNTLSKIAAEDTPFDAMKDQFTETRALVFSFDDPIAQLKVINEFAKENKKLSIKSGLLSERGKILLLDPAELDALSKLPPRDELIAKLLFVLNAPITQFVRTLNEVPAKFVRTLSAIADTKNQQ